MFDLSMPNVHLAMRAALTDDIPVIEPPAPYRLRFFRPGEEEAWSRIEMTAGEFPDVASGLKGFDAYFGADTLLLPGRMYFLADENDVPIATTTAWFAGETGQIHWVAVHADHQRKGLARPLLSAAMLRLRALGYETAALGTQPPSWVAIQLYLEFGFKPVYSENKDAMDGWRLVYEKLGREFSDTLCVSSV